MKEAIKDFLTAIIIALAFVGLLSIWNNFKSPEAKLHERIDKEISRIMFGD